VTPVDALESLRANAEAASSARRRQDLTQAPDDGEAWTRLAGREVAAARGSSALRLIDRALAIDPHSSLCRLGAIAIARATNAGVALRRHLDRALAHDDDPQLRLLRAEMSLAIGQNSQAEEDYRAILRHQPGELAASVNLGAVLNASGRAHEGDVVLRRAVALEPASAPALQNLTFAKLTSGSPQALSMAAAAAAADPLSSTSQVNLAAAADALDRADADRFLRRAIALAPSASSALQMLGRRHSRAFRWNSFEVWTGRALRITPNDPDLALALAHGYLIRGDTTRGWPFWEGRLRRAELQRSDLRGRRWTGQSVEGQTILLHAEQGFGETLQFLRFAPDVAARGGRVVVEVQPALANLGTHGLTGIRVISRGQPLPPHDWHCPLPSVPAVLGIRLDTPPSRMPYLFARPDAVDVWRDRLKSMSRPLIGLCWRGNPAFPDDRRRSPGLCALAGLLDADAAFVSLTRAPADADRPLLTRLYDATAELSDFDATAALIGALDLVITSDTAIAHLAGALAKPTWVLLAHAADWRWLMNREDSPWFPTMRLFRQQKPGDWETIVDEVSRVLRQRR
jgi:tetratricopeptide (TPR) repeat protein